MALLITRIYQKWEEYQATSVLFPGEVRLQSGYASGTVLVRMTDW